MDCLFCGIIEGKIPSSPVWSDDYCYAFKDINPQAPVHVIVVPKAHIPSADRIYEGNSVYVAKIFEAIPKIAEKLDLGRGYRVITNIGKHGCQSVQHLHFHLLGGAQLSHRMN